MEFIDYFQAGGLNRTIFTHLAAVVLTRDEFTGLERVFDQVASSFNSHHSIAAKAEEAARIPPCNTPTTLHAAIVQHVASYQLLTSVQREVDCPNSPLSVALTSQNVRDEAIALLQTCVSENEDQEKVKAAAKSRSGYANKCRQCNMYDHQAADCHNCRLLPFQHQDGQRQMLYRQLPLREQFCRHSWLSYSSENGGKKVFDNKRYFFCDASVADKGCALQTLQLQRLHNDSDVGFAITDGGCVVTIKTVEEGGTTRTVSTFGTPKPTVNRTRQFGSRTSTSTSVQTTATTPTPSTVPREHTQLNSERGDEATPAVSKSLFPGTHEASSMTAKLQSQMEWVDAFDDESPVRVEVYEEIKTRHLLFNEALTYFEEESKFLHDALAQLTIMQHGQL